MEFETYHKIQSVFKRDPDNNFKTFLDKYSSPAFEYLKDNEWIWTEKVDGTNIRVAVVINDIEDCAYLAFGGRTKKAEIPTFLSDKLSEIFTEVLPEMVGATRATPDLILYGEGYGNKIQKVGKDYIPDGVDFVLFDVKVGNIWLERHEVEELAETFNLKVVPIVGTGTLSEAIELTKKGFPSYWGPFMAEGLVLRPKVEIKHFNDRIITKVKHKDFQ